MEKLSPLGRTRYVASSPEKSLHVRIVEELKKRTRDELLETFKREVLNCHIDEFLTKEEQDRLAEYWARWLRGRFIEEEAKRRAKDLGVQYVSMVGRRSRKEVAFLLKKEERTQEMRRLSNRWKRRVERSFGTTQGITDEELINAIAQMRLLRRVEPPFDYERYMKHLFKERQKGRAYKAFL